MAYAAGWTPEMDRNEAMVMANNVYNLGYKPGNSFILDKATEEEVIEIMETALADLTRASH